MIDALSIFLRALGFIAMFQAAGMAIYVSLFKNELSTALTRAHRRNGYMAAMAALALVAAHFCMEPARMGGGFGSIADPFMRELALDSPLAKALAWRMSGLLFLVLGFAVSTRMERSMALLGAALVLVSFTQIGHTSVLSPRPLLGGLLLLHIAIAAFWFGALLPLRAAVRSEPAEDAARIVERFSRIAIWLVPVLFAAGLSMAALMLGTRELPTSPYGRLLILKVMLFGVEMALASLNRWRYSPALAAGNHAAVKSFGRTAIAEYVLITIIFAVTATLTTLYSPIPADAGY